MQHELLSFHNHRVSGVVSSLIACHDVKLLRQPIDNFSFAFVAPLGADNYQISHFSISISKS